MHCGSVWFLFPADLHRVMQKQFYWIGVFLLVMWLVYFVDLLIPYDLSSWGLRPRTLSGLPGIVLMPLLHGGISHLFGNTISLAILLGLLAGSRAKPWLSVCLIVLLGGILLWVIGRNYVHVGASGLAFGLIGLLIVSGFLERRLVAIGVALLVGLMFGGTVLWGLIPGAGGAVSWEGHFCGLAAGVAVAYLTLAKPSWFSNRNF
ncbi:rhomboid family intramembrane serine protease [Stieleria varia]|uniref:Rhomboid family protein n=1 Tax=Stieleria varia TaxID=2528005 RepID=A0A5C6B269_9BACT|nr:rhomboid family intramembrane serine protease [Stieleria varia]TWU04494.1 Rhomboid family protein [Stieleria varia]